MFQSEGTLTLFYEGVAVNFNVCGNLVKDMILGRDFIRKFKIFTTERLQFTVTKDGFAEDEPDDLAGLPVPLRSALEANASIPVRSPCETDPVPIPTRAGEVAYSPQFPIP